MPFWKRKSTSSKPDPGPAQWQGNVVVQQPNRFSQPPPAPQPQPQSQQSAEELFRGRADELFNQGEFGTAAFMYTEAIHQDGQSNNVTKAPLYLQLALAQTLSTPALLNEALGNVNKAIQLNPSSGHAYKLKGDVLDKTGDYHGAAVALTQAVALLPGYDKVQAQQSLAGARMKIASPPSSTTTVPTITQSPPPSAAPATPASPIAQPVASPPPASQGNLSPQSPASPRPTSISSPSSLSPPNIPRAPTPNTMAQGASVAEQLDIPTEAPPSYSSANTGIPRAALGTGAGTEAQAAQFETAITQKRQGSLYLRPFTAENQIDAVSVMFYGKTYVESLLLDFSVQPAAHRSWDCYTVSSIKHPGTNFLDYDCETAKSYDGFHSGTASITGYSEEYREHQLSLKTTLNLFFEGQNPPPPMTADAIVQRLQTLQGNPTLEDNARLSQILGLPHSPNLTTKTVIEDICMVFHRGQYAEPSRFVDFLTLGSFSAHFLGAGGIGFTNFIMHILLGAELSIRLLKLGSSQKYPNIMKTTTSALVIIAHQWMTNVVIRRTLTGTYQLVAANHAVQSEGLLRFGEAIEWPMMGELRASVETLYSRLSSSPTSVHSYLKDWLYGLVLPGKFFRQRIMSCLVLACPQTKNLGQAPFYESGLVVGNKSYWPKRTVLGRVLGGMPNVRTTCGWVGPVPAPAGAAQGWVFQQARYVDFVRPVVDNLLETTPEILGFSAEEVSRDPVGVTQQVLDISRWTPPPSLPVRREADKSAAQRGVKLQAIKLNDISAAGSTTKSYRPNLELQANGAKVTFTLYTNPVFVHVPRCQGNSHPVYEKLKDKYFKNVVLAKDLKLGVSIPSAGTLMIIDATEPGEDMMARAWCAETGRHAVVRKSGFGCFTCATQLATRRTGLGFDVLIWC